MASETRGCRVQHRRLGNGPSCCQLDQKSQLISSSSSVKFATCVVTVGELHSGVTGFTTIYATGSHRFMLQVRNDERDEFNLIQKKG